LLLEAIEKNKMLLDVAKEVVWRIKTSC
jgi:hypothetical protein